MDGWVGAGMHAGQWCGPLPRNRMLPELAHLADLVSELADRWRIGPTSGTTELPAGR
ncbi:hypothetical protein ABIB25_005414 [Nakamurella sp. UYEF19]